jgi:hypothetical protein
VSTEQLERLLRDRAEQVETGPAQRRLAAVDDRVGVLRRRRRALQVVGALGAVVAALAAWTLVPRGTPTGGVDNPPLPPQKVVEPPPELVGDQLPATVTVNEVPYEYFRSVEGPKGWATFRVTVLARQQPQTVVWATPDGTPGRLVVTVDGDVVSRDRAGQLETGLTLSPRRSHLVTLHLTRRSADSTMGVAIYRWPSS